MINGLINESKTSGIQVKNGLIMKNFSSIARIEKTQRGYKVDFYTTSMMLSPEELKELAEFLKNFK